MKTLIFNYLPASSGQTTSVVQSLWKVLSLMGLTPLHPGDPLLQSTLVNTGHSGVVLKSNFSQWQKGSPMLQFLTAFPPCFSRDLSICRVWLPLVEQCPVVSADREAAQRASFLG